MTEVDHIKPGITTYPPGSKERLDDLARYYEIQLSKPPNDRESAFNY